jgi:hypothetical protein
MAMTEYLYMMHLIENEERRNEREFVKIGTAVKPNARRSSLATSHPQNEIALVGYIPI